MLTQICPQIKPLQRSLFMSILDDCEKREARGLANGCQFEALRANAKEWGMTSEMIAYLGGVLFEAGSGTGHITRLQNLTANDFG